MGRRTSRNPAKKKKLEREVARFAFAKPAKEYAAAMRTHGNVFDGVWSPFFHVKVRKEPSRSRPGQLSYSVVISPTKAYEPVWRSMEEGT